MRRKTKSNQLERVADAVGEQKAVKADWKTISLNWYYLTALELNSATQQFGKVNKILFGEVKCLFKLVGPEMLKES